MRYCGVDEAGRGPVIGPMVMAAAVFDEAGIHKLKELGVKDSKRLSPRRRRTLEPVIKDLAIEHKTVFVTPADIDRLRKTISLNQIEAEKTAQILLELESQPEKITVDATDSIAENYRKRILEAIAGLNPEFRIPELVCEHKADDKYPEVSAASIIAKVARDGAIESLKKQLGEFGSGYPSDELTKTFLRKILKEGSMPDCVRKSWNTVEKTRQSQLADY
jgi:ribonuclease HII